MTRFNHTMIFFKLTHSMIETRHLKNVVTFLQTIISFALSRKIILKLHLKFLETHEERKHLCQAFLYIKEFSNEDL